MGTEALAFGTLPYASLHLAIHVYPLTYPLLYNKLVNMCSLCPAVVLADDPMQGGGHGNI